MSTYCITTNSSPPQAWYMDEALYEFTSSDLFWLLLIFIIANCWWVDYQCKVFAEFSRDQKKPEKAEKKGDKVPDEPDSTESPKSPASQHRWLKSQITSEPRRCLAVTVLALVIPVQLLHGSWVLRTLWRWTAAFLRATYPSIKPRTLAFILYSPVTLVIVVIWIAFLYLGVFFVTAQLLCVNEINEMKLSAPSKTSDKVTQQLGDEEWDEVDKKSEQGEGEVDGEKNKEKLAH